VLAERESRKAPIPARQQVYYEATVQRNDGFSQAGKEVVAVAVGGSPANTCCDPCFRDEFRHCLDHLSPILSNDRAKPSRPDGLLDRMSL
jgi:hypothetical protein